jgi:hypothetical protein
MHFMDEHLYTFVGWKQSNQLFHFAFYKWASVADFMDGKNPTRFLILHFMDECLYVFVGWKQAKRLFHFAFSGWVSRYLILWMEHISCSLHLWMSITPKFWINKSASIGFQCILWMNKPVSIGFMDEHYTGTYCMSPQWYLFHGWTSKPASFVVVLYGWKKSAFLCFYGCPSTPILLIEQNQLFIFWICGWKISFLLNLWMRISIYWAMTVGRQGLCAFTWI